MQTSGRKTKYDTAILERAVFEYFNSNKTLEEVAEKYELTKAVLHYHVKKEKKIQEEINNAQANLKRA